MSVTRWCRLACCLLDHDFDAGVGIGWTGYIQLTCKRCGHSERKHHKAL